jgi:putative DNA primase/helicase
VTNLPADLREASTGWVGARLEARAGRLTKVPYCAFDPTRRASSTDPRTWCSYRTARAALLRGDFQHVGFVIRDPYVGVDLDHCRNAESGAIEPWALSIVQRLNSYSEASVSGTGVHVICRGTLPPGARRKGAIEMYSEARYFLMTGRCLFGAAIEERSAELAALHDEVFGISPTLTSTEGSTCAGNGARPAFFDPRDSDLNTVFTAAELPRTVESLTDEQLIERACAAKNGERFSQLWRGDLGGVGSHSEADLALCCHLAFWCQRDPARIDQLFRRSGLYRSKWNRADYRSRTIDRAIACTRDVYEPAAEIPSLPLEPHAPATAIDLDTPNLEAL